MRHGMHSLEQVQQLASPLGLPRWKLVHASNSLPRFDGPAFNEPRKPKERNDAKTQEKHRPRCRAARTPTRRPAESIPSTQPELGESPSPRTERCKSKSSASKGQFAADQRSSGRNGSLQRPPPYS